VALAGLVLLPFATFAANRIVNGVAERIEPAAGPAGWLVVALALAALAACFAPARWRGVALLGLGLATLDAILLALGQTAAALVPPGDTPARVSLAGGVWLALAGAAIVTFQGARSVRSHVVRLAAFALAAFALAAIAALGGLAKLSLAIEYREQGSAFWTLAASHIVLTLAATALAAAIGVPLGIVAARFGRLRGVVIPTLSIVQTVPSLALFGLLIVPLTALGLPSIGTVPALIALTLYALLPIVRGAYLGVAGVDPAVVDAGRGMGMSRRELLWRVELPLALPLVLDGLRAGLILTVGIAAVMAIGGAQTLGTLIFLGVGQLAGDLVLLGALPMVLLAILADQGMRLLERALVSPGVRGEGGGVA
jgi:osmoprotectant transport system permease protein